MLASRRLRSLVRLIAISIAAVWLVPAGVGSPGPASASPSSVRSVIEVFPGPDALSDALDQAHAGDVLNIHAGKYKEHVVVSRNDLTLQSAGDGTVTIDAQCGANYTIFITANGVTIDGLTVIGADEGFGSFPSEIGVDAGADRFGTIRNSNVRNTCDAEYGIQVFQGGSIVITHNKAHGFSDAGIYIGAVTSTPKGALAVVHNESFGNHQGFIVEDSSGGTIHVTDNRAHGNMDAGVFVHNSDSVLIKGNKIKDNGRVGIDLDPTSDDNKVIANLAVGHTFDLVNEGGSSNCFKRNTYDTSSGDITC
jgi:parallel beta-helix repeat protein